ncbi:PucR family transcriptional regulator [Nocardia gipuzkoensis]
MREWLGTLLDYDRDHRADLVHTSSRYLECGGNYDDSAAALHIHRSTLRYRLGRIRELTGFDTRAWRFLSPVTVHLTGARQPTESQTAITAMVCASADSHTIAADGPGRAFRTAGPTRPDQPLRRSGSRSPACSVRGSACGTPSGSCIPRSAVSTA